MTYKRITTPLVKADSAARYMWIRLHATDLHSGMLLTVRCLMIRETLQDSKWGRGNRDGWGGDITMCVYITGDHEVQMSGQGPLGRGLQCQDPTHSWQCNSYDFEDPIQLSTLDEEDSETQRVSDGIGAWMAFLRSWVTTQSRYL